MISRSVLLSMRNVSDKSCREKQNILCSINFSPKIVSFMRCGKIWFRQVTDENMAHAHCMLDTYGYKHKEYSMRVSKLLLYVHRLSPFLQSRITWRIPPTCEVGPTLLPPRPNSGCFHCKKTM